MQSARKINFPWDYESAFGRNIGLVTPDEQHRLRQARVGIPGLGGVGGLHLVTLARIGIENFHIADSDSFEMPNFNRQVGATVSTIGKTKVSVMKDMALGINPNLNLRTWEHPIDESNVRDFLSGCDVVVDSVDAFACDARYAIFMMARKMGIPVITAGPIGFSCSMIVFTDSSMDFETYFGFNPNTNPREKFLRLLCGLTPRPFFLKYMNTEKATLKGEKGPCIASSVALCAGFAATEVLKLLLKRGKTFASPHFHYFDPYLMKFSIGKIPFGNSGPIQRLILYYLDKKLFKDER